MCHHGGDPIHERWELTEASDEEESETDDEPSFAQDERDVDVELLEADDD